MSERLSIENAASGDGETGSFVDAVREGVVNVGVGGHFAAALLASPVFGGAQKSSTDALSSAGFNHIPAFDIADRARNVATIGSGAQTGFEKAENRTVLLCDEN